jgi:SAM-dependent methyltransferase
LSGEEEMSRYDLHENTIDNKGYLNFLDRFYKVISNIVSKGSTGLDFGSGPAPVLAGLFIKRGYNISVYDVYYAPDRSVLNKKYDFITIVEVLEHLKNPGKELRMLWDCLNPGGVIGIMTKFLPVKKDEFSSWSYKNDQTHICFYSEMVFSWISNQFNSKLVFPADDIVLMFKAK